MTKNAVDQDFLEFVVKSIASNPDSVKVDRSVDEMGVLLTLKVSPEDMGQVIGRQGSTAKAIRTILRVIGLKNNARINLKIEEPEGGRAPKVEKEASKEAKNVDEVVDELKL
ncbi:MAG: KH domain-containing protein [bacterium]